MRSRLRCTTSGGGENSTGTMGIFAPALTILRLSRHGVIPAHPISFGRRITWRYLLSELRAWVLSNRAPINVAANVESGRRMAGGSPRKGGR